MDVIKLYRDYGIPFFTEGKNCAPGWVNIQCPFCGDLSNHLGYSLSDDYFACWRCGKKFNDQVIAKLLRISYSNAQDLIEQYGGVVTRITEEKSINKKEYKLPSGTGELLENHRRYLAGRGFDPDQLVHDWGLLGTGPIALLTTGEGENKKTIDFKYRVITPIIWNGKEVSFQGRDITEKSELRYLTCPEDREIIHHKHILGGRQKFWSSTGIIVEGYYDAFRFGLKASCTFGIKYTVEQLRLIAKSFERTFIVFGDEPQAQEQAQKLVADLKFRGVPSERIIIEGDPGGMEQSEADYLVKQLINK